MTLIRVSLVLLLALLAMPLLKGRSAVARRLVLSVAFGAVLVLPFVPAWEVLVPAYPAVIGHVVVDGIVSAAPSAAAVPVTVQRSVDWLALAWALGAFVVATRFVIGLVSARRIVARAVPAPAAWERAITRAMARRRAEVRVSTEVDAPAVTGFVSPVILVPESSSEWSEERRFAVLVHELAHVSARDLAVQLLATIVCSLHWFNPLAWLAARRLRLERELAADEAVLRSGVRASSYAQDLLAIAGAAPAGTIAIGAKPLPARIAAIVAARRPASLGPLGASTLALGTAAISLGVACTTNDQGPPIAAPRPVEQARPVAAPANDDSLQGVAERELDRVVTDWKASGGTVLVLSPKGEVLADAGGRSDHPYVTGSTMKSLLLAAAIDEGAVNERDVFDASPGARAAVPELLATSSNVGFSQMFDRLGASRLDRSLRRFHFAPPSELLATTAIGATMTATPRQVALAYATLADGGDGIVKLETAARVTTLLEGVVTSEHGTGRQARVTGARVAGKTGTSDWTEADGTKKTYASFVGYLPADRPQYVIFVGVESPIGEGPWGGAVAAPVFSRIAARALAR